MLTGQRGSVVVDLPMDVQCDSAEVEPGSPRAYRPVIVGGSFQRSACRAFLIRLVCLFRSPVSRRRLRMR